MSKNSTTYHSTEVNEYLNPGGSDYVIIDPFVNAISPNMGYSFPTAPTIKLMSRKTNFGPTTLGSTTKVYTTPNTIDVIDLCNYYADFGCSYDVETGPVYKVSINVPFDEITQEDYYISQRVTETWELTPVTNQKSLVANAFYIDSGQQLSAPNNVFMFPDPIKAAIYYAFNNSQTVIKLSDSASVSYANWLPYAQGALSMMRSGITSVPAWGQTLKRTSIVNNANSNNSFHTQGDVSYRDYLINGNKTVIYSRDEMLQHYLIPSATIGTLMFPSYTKTLSITGGYDTGMPVKVFAGYMAQPPTFQFITKNKVQMTQNFVWDEWMDHLYYIPGRNNTTLYPVISQNAW